MTWEYAIVCGRYGVPLGGHFTEPDAPRSFLAFYDIEHCCGPHRVVRRQVGDWEPVDG